MTAPAAAPSQPALSPRRWAVWTTVVVGAAAAVALSLEAVVASPPRHDLVGIGVLLLVTLAGERWPVPVADGEMSLAAVPIACAAVMYGASVTALVAASAHVLEAARRRDHVLRIAFNAGVFALMGGAAGLAAHVHPGDGAGLVVAVVLAAAAEWITNTALVALMIVHARLREFFGTSWQITRAIALPFGLSLSIVPLFIVTWHRYPYVAVLAIAPLVAIGLHLRSLHASRLATVLALTDELTGLGNRRSFDERLAKELDRADETGLPLSLCILDVDAFKTINDTRGHDAGDEALVAVAGVLRRDGEAFRLGGDEFVLVLPGLATDDAHDVAAAVIDRVRDLGLSISVGVATYAADGDGRSDLVRRADERLYDTRATRR